MNHWTPGRHGSLVRQLAWAAAAAACLAAPATAQTIERRTAATVDKTAGATDAPSGIRNIPRSLPNLPPPGPPPVGLTAKGWNPGLHQVTWSWDGVHGALYYQLYKIDPQSPGGRLVRDRSSTRELWDSSFVAPGTTTYRVVAFYPDGSQGVADFSYANPPQPQAPPGFNGEHWSAGTVKLTWQRVNSATGYRLFGPNLPPEGVVTTGTSHLVTGLPPGNHTFTIATGYAAGWPTSGLGTAVATVRPTSGQYRILITGVQSNQETRDDPFDFDGKRDEIYAAAYTAVFPWRQNTANQSSVAQTRVYGDANQAPDRIRAGSGSPLGGVKAGDKIPDGFHPVPQPGVAAYNDRFPLLVWQGVLQDSGETVTVHPTVWESDRNTSGNLSRWVQWWTTPNGAAILSRRTYASRDLGPIMSVWLGERDESGFPFQPGMTIDQGLDRPVGIGGVVGITGATANANSLGPKGLIFTRERIERALGPSARVYLIPVNYYDRVELAGNYTVFVQVERMP